MYCPRCGAQAGDTAKFCRGCGLPLIPIAGYVASAGTTPILSATQVHQSPKDQVLSAWYGLTWKQQMILSILFFCFLPGIFGVLGDMPGPFHIFRALTPIAGIMVPLGIVFSVFRARSCKARQIQAAAERAAAMQTQTYNQALYTQPMAARPAVQPAPEPQLLAPQQTNPLNEVGRGSVVEDETQRLPMRPPMAQ